MKNQFKSILMALAGLFVLTVSAFAHSDAFKPEFVDSLIPDYLHLQSALASDDLAVAKSSAQDLLTKAKKGPEFSNFTQAVEAIVGGADLDSVRVKFQTVSTEMQDLIDHVGTTGKHLLFLAHCPMALDGKGGDWLQADKTLMNPYFGSMMLHCGSIGAQVSGEKGAADSDAGAHPHH